MVSSDDEFMNSWMYARKEILVKENNLLFFSVRVGKLKLLGVINKKFYLNLKLK